MFDDIIDCLRVIGSLVWDAVKIIFDAVIEWVAVVMKALTDIVRGLGDAVYRGWKAFTIRIARKNEIPKELLDSAFGAKIKRTIDNGGVIHISGTYNGNTGKVDKVHEAHVAAKEDAETIRQFQCNDGILVAD